MRNIVMSVSYEGTNYCGFQTQPNLDTVQEQIEKALLMLTGEMIEVIASGRTDAGVHARRQIFNFLTESQIPIERWCIAMNTRLPNDIVIHEAMEVPIDFHSRYSVKRKTYRYCIHRSKFPSLFARHTRFHHPMPLDIEAMAEALSHLVGEHTFTSFCSIRTAVGSHVRTIYDATIYFEPEPVPGDGAAGVIQIEITGNGFLYNMVRIIVGTIIQVGTGKRKSSDIPKILAAQNRKAAGPTAMAHGLILWNVEY